MKKRQSGLTMLEVLIASVILAAVISMAGVILWSSSNHVASSEVGVQLEAQAREVIAAITRELHQAKMSSVKGLDTTVALDLNNPGPPSTILNSVVTWPDPGPSLTFPYVVWDIKLYHPTAGKPQPPIMVYNYTTAADDANPATSKPHGIRFNIPGSLMDLDPTTTVAATGIKNVNANLNGQVDSNGKVIDNFDLKKFKNTPSGSADWTTEIQYWRDPDLDNPWAGGGKISAGVVKRFETLHDSSGGFTKRKYSIVARNVSDLTFVVLKYPAWVTMPAMAIPLNPPPPPLPAPQANQYSAGGEKCILISLTLQAPDPKFPKDVTRVIYRTVTSMIDLRN